jgi:hypothetical protein
MSAAILDIIRIRSGDRRLKRGGKRGKKNRNKTEGSGITGLTVPERVSFAKKRAPCPPHCQF